jgi:hypothetical protein
MICGLDLGSRLTGWCVGDGRTVPSCGAFEFPQVGADLGALGDLLWRNLDSLWRDYPFRRIMLEAPILIVNDRRRGTDNLLKLRKLYGISFVVETWARRHPSGPILVEETSLQSLKKELAGSVKADKAAMVAVAERLGLRLPEHLSHGREDAADAFAAWLVGLRFYAKPESARWDQAIYSRRGFLI